MAKFIAEFNHFSEIWFGIIRANSLQLILLFLILSGIVLVLHKRSPIFLYTVWLLFLLKAVLLPVIRIPLFHQSFIPLIPLNAIIIGSSRFMAATDPNSVISLTTQSVLFLVWILGIISLVFIYVRNEYLFHKLLKDSEPFAEQTNLAELATRLGINHPIAIRFSANAPAPFTKGFNKPVIYLPRSALGWNGPQLNHVLCHELAHVKRNDILPITLQNIINVLYFFHPLVWLANQQLNFQREKICDDIAVSILNENPVKYGRTLMDNLESYLINHRLPLIANGLFFSRKTIIRRFEYLLNHGKEIKMKLGLVHKTAIALLGVLIIFMACSGQSDKTKKETAPPKTEVEFVDYDTPPQPIEGFADIQQNLVYPKADKEAGHAGTVIVQAFVDENGDVTEATVKDSPGWEGLDKAAINAIKQTKFKPALKGEKPMGVYITVPVKFKLEDKPAE
jgi:TonB family protein